MRRVTVSSGGRDHRQRTGRSGSGEVKQRIDLQVLLDEVGQEFEASVAGLGEADIRWSPSRIGPRSDFTEECRAELIRLQAAVPHGAEDLTGADAVQERLTMSELDATVVDLITLCGNAQRLASAISGSCWS